MAKSAEQEAFYTSLRVMSQATSALRQRRETDRRQAAQLGRTYPDTVRASSRIRIQIPGHSGKKADTVDEFKATLMVAKRLTTLSDEDTGDIVCLKSKDCEDCGSSCQNLQSIWLRSGKSPPEVVFSSEPLSQVLERRPIMILLDESSHEGEVPGYHKVVMGDTSFLLRQNGE